MGSRLARIALLAVMVGLACVGGCSRRSYSLAPVTGRVTLDGAPLAGGVVNFQPQATGATTVGPGSTGRIDADGRYQLASIDGVPGAVVGRHLVRIYSRSPESAPKGDTDSPGSRERVPSRYNYASELTFEVGPGGAASADFELKGDGPKAGR